MKTRTVAFLTGTVVAALLLTSQGFGQGVVVSAGGPYSAAVNEPIIFRGVATGGVGEPLFEWDLVGDDDTYETPGRYPMHSYAAAGTYTITVKATLDSTDYTDTTTVTVTGGPKPICVPWQLAGTIEIPHTAIANRDTRLKAVVYGKAPLKAKWTFGDFSETDWLDLDMGTGYKVKYTVEQTHKYLGLPDGVDSKPFVATLTVEDGDGNMASDNYHLRVYQTATLDLDINVAVDEALWYLHKAQTRTGARAGLWEQYAHGLNAMTCQTGSILQGLQVNGHLLLGDPGLDPYVYDVRLGFDGMMARLTKISFTGAMDANGNGFGIQSADALRPIYEGGQVMDAICATQLPDYRIYAGTVGITYGRRLVDIVQDMVDMYAWGQDDAGTGYGGWMYSWNNDSDNSAAQWAAIGMMPAEDIFGCTIPASVKDANYAWLSATNNTTTGGYGYRNRTAGWATSASGLVQLIFDKGNDAVNNVMWDKTEQYYVNNWQNDFNPGGSSPNYYAAYAFAKAMRLAKPDPVTHIGSSNFDWFGSEGSTKGLGRIICNYQKTSANGTAAWGSWTTYNSGAYGYINTYLATAWATTILTQSLFELVPVAEAGRNIIWGKDLAYTLDASYSYHLDPQRRLVKYEWIMDGPDGFEPDFHYIAEVRDTRDGAVYDWYLDGPGDQTVDITTDSPAIAHTWEIPYEPTEDDFQPYTVTLKVTDDNDPAQIDIDTFAALILEVKPPQSAPGGPYIAYEGIPVQLDGSGSSEWDPGDYITQYDWELTGDSTIDKTGDSATASVFNWPFNTLGTLTIGLTVYDNGVGLPQGERLSHTAYTTVEVLPNNAPVADAGGPYTLAEGESVQLTAQGSSDPDGHILSYAWDLDNDGQFDDGSAQVVTFSVSDHGPYTVRVQVSDGGKTDDDDALVTVTDKSPNVAFHAVPSAPYEGQEVRFISTSTSTPDTLASWDWDFDVAGGATSDSLNEKPTHMYAENGVYTVKLTVKDDDDVTGASLEQQITVRDTEPSPNFTFSPLTPVLIARRNGGVEVTFTDTSVVGQDPIVLQDWVFSDGGEASGAQVTHTYTAIGTYYVTLTVQDDDGFPRSITKQVSVTAPADLVISAVNATPLPLIQGGQVEFSATVTNQGTGDVVVPFLVDFSMYGAGIGATEVISLAAGSSRTVTKYWTTVPGPGDPILRVTADSADVVTEANGQGTAETNNVNTLSLAAFSLPDLELENPGVNPASPVQGDVVSLQVTLKNTGLGDTRSPIKVDFHLDGTEVGTTTYSQGLSAGSRASVQIQLPWIALAGAEKPLRVVVDPDNTVPEEAGDGETNNEVNGTVAGIAYPDLTVTDISWSPPTLKQGNPVTFYVTVENIGATTELDLPVRVKVGTTVVGTPHVYRGLEAGESAIVSTIWVATHGVNLQVEATADPGNPGIVPETQENDGTGNDNNVYSEALGDIALPDLIVEDVKTIPTTGLAQGMVVELLATVKNAGQATAPANARVVFEVDGATIGNKAVGRVLQGQDQVVLALPWTVTAGTHTFQAVADPTEVVIEALESNNTSELLTLNGGDPVGLPDLTVSDLVWDKPTPNQGETVNLAAKVWNIGARTTLPVLVSFDVDGHTIATQTYQAGLEAMDPETPSAAKTVTATWTAESGSAHRIAVHVDHPLSIVPETNENNNVLFRDFGVVAAPDLVVDSITADPVDPDQGDTVTLTATVRNAGGATTQNIPVRFSVDGTTLIDRIIGGGLSAGASDTVNATWTARAGEHTVQAMVNASSVIAESNEGNNTASQIVAVGYPKLDIDGASISWSASSRGAGAPITLSLDVVNNGQGETLNSFNVTLYEDDVAKYTTRVTDLLAADAEKTVTLIWIAKGGVAKLTLRDDSADEVRESDELGRGDSGRGYELEIVIPEVTPAPTISFDGIFPPSSTPADPYSGIQTVGWAAAAGEADVSIKIVGLYALRNGGRYLIYSEGYLADSVTDSHDWQTAQLAGGAPFGDGVTQLVARVEDINGGWAETTSVPFSVDNTPEAHLLSNAARRSALIDETRSYQFTIKNGQEANAIYDISVTAPGDLTTQLDQPAVAVSAWDQATFNLMASSSAAGSAEITVTATERLQTRNDPLVASIKVYLDTKEPVEVSLAPTGSQTVAMGGSLPCQITIVNNQRTVDIFSLSIGGVPAAWVSGLPETVQLAAGGRTTRSFQLVGLDAHGTFAVTVTALSANRGTTYPRAFQVQTNPDPSISNLRPTNNTRFGARDVTISWTTVVDATTEVYYRSEAWTGARAVTYELATGIRGTRHSVRLTNLERNRKYFFYVNSVSDYGAARYPLSGESAFIVDNGIVFSQNTYDVTLNRDYGGEAAISVRNTDSTPHEVYLTVSNIPEELAVGFVGAGHDTKLIVAPGASHNVLLGIFTQDAQVPNYGFDLHLETDPDLPDPIVDDAKLSLRVNFPVTDFSMQVIGSDPGTLGKRVRLTNNGDPVTDFQVVPDEDLFGGVRINPDVTHGYLKNGESLTFWVYPELHTGFQYLAGYINAYGAGDSTRLFLEFATPEGQQFFNVQVTENLPDPMASIPTNLEAKLLEMTDTKRVIKFHLPGTEETDYVIYTIADTEVPDPDPGNPQALYIDPDNWFASSGTGAALDITYQVTLPVETNSRGRALGFTRRAYNVASSGTDTAMQINDHYNQASGWVDQYNECADWGDSVNGNTGIADDMKAPVKMFHDFLSVGSDLVGDLPLVGDLLAPMFKAATETFKNGVDIFSKHNRDLNEVFDLLEGKTTGRDWYCTNRPRVSSSCSLPSWVDPQYVNGASIGLRIQPNLYGTQVQPHDLELSVNGVPVALLEDDVHSGFFAFDIPPGILNYATGLGPAANSVTVNSFGFNPGHYASAYDFFISLSLTDAVVPVVAETSALADIIWDWVRARRRRPDFSVTTASISYGRPARGRVTEPKLRVRLNNEGWGSDVTLVTVKVDGSVISQFWAFVGGYSRKEFVIDGWSPSRGTQTVTCELWSRAHEVLSDNNTASRTFSFPNPTTDTAGPVVSALFPATGATVDNAYTRISASYSDPSGIDIGSVRLAVDGVDVTGAATVAAGQVMYEPVLPFAGGSRNVALEIDDQAGNRTTRTWSFTVDTSVPVLTNLEVINVTDIGAIVVWETNLASDSMVRYGPNPDLLENVKFDDAGVTAHEIRLGGLTPATTYYFEAFSTRAGGHMGRSGVHTFFTGSNNLPDLPSVPSPADGVADVVTSPLMSWECSDADASDSLLYDLYIGTDPDLVVTGTTRAAAGVTVVERLDLEEWQAESLSFDTQYYWRIVATDSRGGRTIGNVWGFRTAANTGGFPEISNVLVTPAVVTRPAVGSGQVVNVVIRFTATKPLIDLRARWGARELETPTETSGGERGQTTYETTYAITEESDTGVQPVVVGGSDEENNPVSDSSRSLFVELPATPPTAGFTYATTTPRSLTVAFQDMSTDATSWTWDFEATPVRATTVSEQHPVHTYAVPGEYLVRLTAANNAGSEIAETVIDLLGPSVSITSDSLTNNATPIIEGTATATGTLPGSVDPVSVSLTIDDATYDQNTSPAVVLDTETGIWSLDLATRGALSDGAHDVTVSTADSLGNTTEAAGTVTVDTVMPTVTYTAPATLTNNNTPTFTGTVADGLSGVEQVAVSVFTVVGRQVPHASGTATVANGIWTFDVTDPMDDGAYSVEIVATDYATNEATASEIVTVDATKPELTVASVVTNNSMPTLIGDASDNLSGVAGVTVSVSLAGTRTPVVSGPASYDPTEGKWNYDVRQALPDGAYIVDVTATDQATNREVTAGSLTVDTGKPGLTVTTPVLTNNNTPTLAGAVSDSLSGVARVEVSVSLAGTRAPVVSGLATYDPAKSEWHYAVPQSLPDDVYVVEVAATDHAANSRVVNDSLTVDTGEPELTAEISAFTNDNTPTLTGTVSDGLSGVAQVAVSVSPAGGPRGTGVPGTADVVDGTWTFEVAQALDEGTYDVLVTATDNATNKAIAPTATMTVDIMKPELTVASVVTNNSMPTLTGATSDSLSGVAGVTVSVSLAGTRAPVVSGLATHDPATGEWRYDVPQALPDDVYVIEAVATDQATNTKAATNGLTVDTTEPELTMATSAVINDNTPTLAGTVSDSLSGVAEVTVSVYPAGDTRVTNASGPADVDAGGNWSFDVSTALDDGEYMAEVTATDVAGNVQVKLASTTLDTTAPILTVTLPATTIRQPTLSGTASDSLSGVSSISVTLIDPQGRDVFRNEPASLSRGAWALPYPDTAATLDYGRHSVSVVATDVATNAANQTVGLQITPNCELIAIGNDAPGTRNKATALNDSEDVIGTYTDDNRRGSFKWTNGAATELSRPVHGAEYVSAQAIDDNGWVIGYSVTSRGTEGVAWTDVGTPASILQGSAWGSSTALLFGLAPTSSGTRAIGAVSDAGGVMRAVNVGSGGGSAPTELAGLVSGSSAYAYAGNASGIIVGKAKDENGVWRAVKWESDVASPVSLDTLNSLQSVAEAVNAVGVIVGYRVDAASMMRPWIYSDGGMNDLPTLSGRNAAALAINDEGLIVGWAQTAEGTAHAVMWKAGHLADLNDLVPNAGELDTDTVLLTKAVDINSSMCIVGQADFRNEELGVEGKAYLLRPVDSSLPGENLLPVARIVQPTGDLRIRLGDTLTITASVVDLDGALSSVTASAKTGHQEEQLGSLSAGSRAGAEGYAWAWTPSTGGSYSVTVVAADDEGEVVSDQIFVEVMEGNLVTFEIDLQVGWSFVSVPFTPVDPHALLAALAPAWEYTGAAYKRADVIKPKVAYWVWSGMAKTVSFSGYTLADTTAFVTEGWNAIGSANNASAPFSVVFRADMELGIPHRQMYGWSPSNGSYYLVPGEEAAAGHGYWFRTDQAGRLTVGPEYPPQDN